MSSFYTDVHFIFLKHTGLFSKGLVSEYTSQREKRPVPVNGARIQFQLGFKPPALPILQGSFQGEECSGCSYEVTALGRG